MVACIEEKEHKDKRIHTIIVISIVMSCHVRCDDGWQKASHRFGWCEIQSVSFIKFSFYTLVIFGTKEMSRADRFLL